MDHKDIRHKLSEFIDGAVAPGEKTAIEQHLKTCSECADALRELRKTIEHIHAIEEVKSPAWMTQKIMAKVRTDAEEKKGWSHRLFTPLAVKLPIQTVAVLFLTVTAYYIYSSSNPAQKHAQEQDGMLAKKDAPAIGRMKEERKAIREAAPEAKQASRKPGYKSLDMKYSYETPSEPVPLERPAASAPAPAKRAEQAVTANEVDLADKRALSPKTAAPMMADQAAPLSVKTPAGLSSGVSRNAELKREKVSEGDKTKSAFRVKSYLEFIRTIERFPYEAPRSRKDRVINNYGKLVSGMTKEEIAFIIGEPDYSTDAQASDPPFRRPCAYWTYNLSIKDPKLVSLDTDRFLNIFFDVREKAYSFSPHNIPDLARKGERLDPSK